MTRAQNRRFFIRVHPLGVVGFLCLVLFNEASVLLFLLSSALIHEAGHLFAALLQHRRVYGLKITLGGAEFLMDLFSSSYGADVLLHLAGPLSNGAAAGFVLLLIRSDPSELRFFAFYLNAALCFFHLLPLSSLDGGRALYALLCCRGEPERAEAICRRAECLTLCFLGAVWIFALLFSGFHLSLFALFLFCLPALWDTKKSPQICGDF